MNTSTEHYNNPIFLLRIAVVTLTLTVAVGTVYYGLHYIRLAINRTTEQAPATISPTTAYELVVRVRVGETREPAPNTSLLIEEYGQPVGRNLIATTVTTNAVGTAIVSLPSGQYTIRPKQTDQWSGLSTVNLTGAREVSLLLEPASS